MTLKEAEDNICQNVVRRSGMRQRQFKRHSGIALSQVNKIWKHGEGRGRMKSGLTLQMIVQLADALGVEPVDLLNPPPPVRSQNKTPGIPV